LKRRHFIQYLSAVGSATLIDPDKVASALGGITRLDERLLDDLEAVTKSLVDDYWTASPASVVPAVEGHLGGLRNLLASQAVGGVGRRLRRIASDTAALGGWLAFRLESRSDAHALWAFAAALAEEAGDGPLRAYALISRSNLYSATWRDGQGGDTDTAIALLDAAEAATGSLSSPLLRAWLYARRAEEHAVQGAALGCYADLERAAEALSQASTSNDGFLRSWNLDQLAAYQGNCAQLLGRPQEAAMILEEALPRIPPSLISQRCAALTNLASAHAQRSEEGVEQACVRLSEALAVAGPAGLAVAQQRILGVRDRRLASLAKLPAVQQLDEQLRIWTTPS
jgi:tetratricopeptide (TPR) repeat protein